MRDGTFCIEFTKEYKRIEHEALGTVLFAFAIPPDIKLLR